MEIVTAPDGAEHARRALNQEYDLVIISGRQARMPRADLGRVFRALVARSVAS